jgi:NADPH:quinone reductase-like Zn-dependent oxidoreductase
VRAVLLERHGPAENLKIVDLPIPEPDEDEVLINVELAGIVFADTQMRRGDYVRIPPLPFIPGREVSGQIHKVGSKVRDLQSGMRVMAFIPQGGYAEFATAKEDEVVKLPDHVAHSQGIVYLVNLRIAHLNYTIFGQTRPDDTILIHAGAGGIGTLITQIAKRRANNIVITLSSSDEKAAYCKANGADHCLNYNKTDYVKEVLQITDGQGVDISFNSVGGSTFQKDPMVIKALGRWVIFGYAAGKDVIEPYQFIMPKSLTLIINSVYTVRDRDEYKQATEFMLDWINVERLDSVSKIFTLEEVIEAHHWIEDQHSVGKIAMVM